MPAASNRYPASRPVYNPRPARPVAANDNRPRVRAPFPANDNTPAGWRPRVPPGVGRRAVFWMAARSAARFVPIVGAVLTAADLIKLGSMVLGMLELPRRVPPGYRWEPCVPPPPATFYGYSTLGNICGNWNQTNPPLIDPRTFTSRISFYEWGQRGFFPSQIRVGRYVVTSAGPVPVYPFPRVTLPVPVHVPSPDPLTPPGYPMPEPVPLPVRRPNWDPLPNPETGIPPVGSHPPVGRIDRPPVVGPDPLPARRPGRGDRERKVMASARARKLMGWALSQFSEVGDLVDALYDALPDDVQSNDDKNLAQKFKRLYDNIDRVDMAEAMTNMINDQVTDPKFAEQFERMQNLFESYGIEVPDLRGTSGSSGLW